MSSRPLSQFAANRLLGQKPMTSAKPMAEAGGEANVSQSAANGTALLVADDVSRSQPPALLLADDL